MLRASLVKTFPTAHGVYAHGGFVQKTQLATTIFFSVSSHSRARLVSLFDGRRTLADRINTQFDDRNFDKWDKASNSTDSLLAALPEIKRESQGNRLDLEFGAVPLTPKVLTSLIGLSESTSKDVVRELESQDVTTLGKFRRVLLAQEPRNANVADWSASSSSTTNLIQGTKEGLQKGFETIKETGGEAANIIATGVEKARQAIDPERRSAALWADPAKIPSPTDPTQNSKPLSSNLNAMYEGVKEKVQQVVDVKRIQEGVKEKVQQVVEVAQDKSEQARKTLEQQSEQAKKRIQEGVKEKVQQAANVAQEKREQAMKTLEQQREQAKTYAQQVTNPEHLGDVYDATKKRLQEVVDTLPSKVKEQREATAQMFEQKIKLHPASPEEALLTALPHIKRSGGRLERLELEFGEVPLSAKILSSWLDVDEDKALEKLDELNKAGIVNVGQLQRSSILTAKKGEKVVGNAKFAGFDEEYQARLQKEVDELREGEEITVYAFAMVD
jgi:hypothetical protein